MHFYVPQKNERADQPPTGMIAINEPMLEVELQFLLCTAISYLLMAWNQSITQITPNGWSYILVIMTLLGQVGLYRMLITAELNYLVVPIAQAGGYNDIRL